MTNESEKPVVREGVLALSGYGLRLAVERGHLITEDGAGVNRRVGRFARVTSGIRRLIVLGHSGTVSLEALRWLHEIDAAFVQIGSDGELIAAGAPKAVKDVRVRRGQAVAMLTDGATDIARQLIVEKVRGQYAILDLIENARENRALVEETLARLDTAASVEELTFWESRAAAAYWKAWENIPVIFARRDAKVIPAHWQYFGTRSSVLTSSPRKAASPGNALLNYLYAILEAESCLAAIAVGCDPAMGVVHTDRSRNSFACDLMEPARPHVDLYLLKLLRSQTFNRSDFFETRDGNCRLMPEITRPLTSTATMWGQAVAPWAERIAGAFGDLPLALAPTSTQNTLGRSKHRTPLTQQNRSRPRNALAKASGSWRFSALGTRCKGCGMDLGKRKRVYCDTCLPAHAAIASKKGVEVQAMLRATGNDKRSSVAVREKHRASAIRQNALNAAWEAAHMEIPSPAVFRREILPGLKSVSVARLRSASGLSESACKKMRSGDLVPHPRHWAELRKLG